MYESFSKAKLTLHNLLKKLDKVKWKEDFYLPYFILLKYLLLCYFLKLLIWFLYSLFKCFYLKGVNGKYSLQSSSSSLLFGVISQWNSGSSYVLVISGSVSFLVNYPPLTSTLLMVSSRLIHLNLSPKLPWTHLFPPFLAQHWPSGSFPELVTIQKERSLSRKHTTVHHWL